MRNLYLAFVAAFAIMAAGFWPSTLGSEGPPDAVRIVHGMLAAAWLLLVIAQSWLAGRGRLRWHRRFGWASVALVPVLIASSILVVRSELATSTYFSRDLRLTLTWADIWTLVLFTMLWIGAIANRRRWPLHARYAASTVLVILPPAIGRLYAPAFGGLTRALHPAFFTVDAAIAALLVRDLAKKGPWVPYAIALGGIGAFQATMFAAPGWPWFVALIEAFTTIG